MGAILTFLLLISSAAAQTSYTIATVAGGEFAGDGGPALSAILGQPEGVVYDASGNLYIADAADNRVRMITPGGTIQTFAGTGAAGFSGDGGPANAAQLSQPYGLSIDADGNIYIADLGNARVRQVTPAGVINTFAGGGTIVPGGNGDGGPATLAQFLAPRNVASDRHGTLFISDFGAQQVYRISPNGTLTTVAGTGIQGFTGDGGAASLAQLAFPAGLAIDNHGTLYIADSINNCIRAVIGNTISAVAFLSRPTGIALDANGNLYVAGAALLGAPGQPVSGSAGFGARDLTVDIHGNLVFSAGAQVQQTSLAGQLTTLAGSSGSQFAGDGADALDARLNAPDSVAVDAAGNLYIADQNNNRIRMVTPGGLISTVAGTGDPAILNQPSALAADGSGNLYIADTGNNRVLKLTAGVLSVAVDHLNAPSGLTLSSDASLYIADTGNGSIKKLSATGVVIVAATVSSPSAIALDSAGNLYASQTAAGQVVKISPSGAVTVLLQSLLAPAGLALDGTGDLFIAESGGNRILEFTQAGSVLVLAGSKTPGFGGDGGPAPTSLLNAPLGLALDMFGNLFVADSGNNRIRELSPPSTTVVPPPDVTAPLVIVNAASSLGGPIAPSEIVTVYGAGFDPKSTVVNFNGQPTTLFYVGTTQINLLAPATLVPGTTAIVDITALGAPVGSANIAVAAAAPALFTIAAGTGQAAALNQDSSVNSSSNPASHGAIAVLFATGQGAGTDPVSVTMNGAPSEILYAGPAPGFVGLMQINARIPSGFVPSGDLPVVLQIGSASSQPGVTIAVR